MRKLIVYSIIIWSLGVTIARAWRLPPDWALAHWLLDYRFGFMKRGLIGTLCNAGAAIFSFQMNPNVILVLSTITYEFFCLSFLFIILRFLRLHGFINEALILAVVFVSSPFMVMSAQVFGYFDALLYGLAIVSILLIFYDRPFCSAFVSIVAVLTHESYMLIGFPLTCLAAVSHHATRGRNVSGSVRIIAGLVPLMVFFALALLPFFAMDRLQLCDQLFKHLTSYGFLNKGTSAAIASCQTTTFMDFARLQLGHITARLMDGRIMISVGPPLLAILYYIYSSFKIRFFSFLSLVTLISVCAPLAMHTVAWDTSRISTYTVGGAFIALWIISETHPVRRTAGLFMFVAVTALLLNITGRIPLMQQNVERFTTPVRLVLYSPALVLALYSIVHTVKSLFFHKRYLQSDSHVRQEGE